MMFCSMLQEGGANDKLRALLGLYVLQIMVKPPYNLSSSFTVLFFFFFYLCYISTQKKNSS